MKIQSFEEALTSVYVDNPCRILPNALWKALVQINNFHTDFTIENNKVKSLKLWNNDMLYTYWYRYKTGIDFEERCLNNLRVALVHETQLNSDLKDKFSIIKPYFRLVHKFRDIVDTKIPSGYYIKDVDINTELHIVSDLICNCYEDIKPNTEEVLKWTGHPVFKKDLWIWIIDKNTEKPAALGIAEFDMNIKEGSLEWIQVLPDYQGKGLGKVLVIELLNRLKSHAGFVTVSGEVDNKTNPQKLYRSCGFYGDDVWYVLRK